MHQYEVTGGRRADDNYHLPDMFSGPCVDTVFCSPNFSLFEIMHTPSEIAMCAEIKSS